MADVLVDTDVLVDHLRGAARFRPGRDRVSYSVLTRCELFSGRHVDEVTVRGLLAAFREIGVSRTMAEQAGRIRRSTGVTLPDAIIAATAIERRVSLLTRNQRDFRRVPKLRVRAPK